MTRDEALKEAQRRWGTHANVFIGSLTYTRFVFGPDEVNQFGFGDTWEAAFADADRRARND